MVSLQLGGMLLTGTLPDHHLPSSLIVLNITNTQVSGPIPENYFQNLYVNQIILNNNDLRGTISAKLGNLQFLNYLDLSSNALTGTIPTELYKAGYNGGTYSLRVINLSNNFLTGTVPTEFSNWDCVQTMLLHTNMLENAGSFAFLPPQSPGGASLRTLDISNNRFTGTLPDFIFGPTLTTFAASQNCLHGMIPNSICSATGLETLALMALNSGESCRDQISVLGWKFPGFLAQETMSGKVPDCIYTLPALRTLLLAFLNLEGSVPEKISLSMELFSLQGNRFTGSLSNALVTSPNLKSLVLSHNYISGSLDAFNAGRNYDLHPMKLQLGVNAISGTVPFSLLSLKSINILYGNLFACEDGTASLPQYDKTTKSYSCGSSAVNQVVYVLGALVASAFVAHLLLRNRLRFNRYTSEISLWLQVVDNQRVIDVNIHASHLLEYQSYLFGVIFFSMKVSAYIFALGLTYAILARHEDRTVEHVYSWAVSSAYLYGDVPSIICLIGWAGLMLLVCIFTVQESSRVKNERKRIGKDMENLAKPLNPNFLAEKDTPRTWSTTFVCMLRLSIFFSIIVGVIVAMNALYLHVDRVATSPVQTSFKLWFAIFKLAWSNVVTQRLYHTSQLRFGVEESVHDQFVVDVFHSKASVLLLASNMVQFIVPFAVTIFLSPACLQLAFDPDPPVKYSYTFMQGIMFSGATAGQAEVMVNGETLAPFVYSTNCFSTILKTYVPLYGAMFFMSLTKSLLQFIYLLWSIAYKNDPTAVDTVWYRGLLQAIHYTLPLKNLCPNSRSRKKLYTPGKVWQSFDKLWVLQTLVYQMDRILLLVTYGALCPPLGFLIMSSMVADSYIEKMLMGRFVTREITAIHEYWNRQDILFARSSAGSGLRRSTESFAESFGIRGSCVFSSIGSTLGIDDDTTLSSGRVSSITSASRASAGSRSSTSSAKVSSSGDIADGAMREGAEMPRATESDCRTSAASDSQDQHKSFETDIQDAAEPWGALAALTEVDQQCSLLPASLLKLSNGTFINAQALLFGFALFDMQNGGGRFVNVSWAFWVMLSVFAALRLWMWAYGVFFKKAGGGADSKGNDRAAELELGQMEDTTNPMYDENGNGRSTISPGISQSEVLKRFLSD